jgi:ribonuclease P protein component
MLPKQYRLKKRIAFNATYRTGQSLHKNGVTVFCGRNKYNTEPTKIGFVVSKKIHKRAVKRNRIKRLMRESVRLYIKNKQNIDNCKHMSLIFVASSKLLDKNFSDVNYAVTKLLDKIIND